MIWTAKLALTGLFFLVIGGMLTAFTYERDNLRSVAYSFFTMALFAEIIAILAHLWIYV